MVPVLSEPDVCCLTCANPVAAEFQDLGAQDEQEAEDADSDSRVRESSDFTAAPLQNDDDWSTEDDDEEPQFRDTRVLRDGQPDTTPELVGTHCRVTCTCTTHCSVTCTCSAS